MVQQCWKGEEEMSKGIKFFLLLVVTILVGLPLLFLILLSLSKGYAFPRLFPEQMSLEGYGYLLTSHPNLLKITIDSIKLSTMVAVLSVMIGMLAGKGISGPAFKGQKIVKRLMFIPMLMPMVSVAMGLHIVFLKFHLANKVIGVILIQLMVSLPYAVLIFTDLFDLVGDKWFELGELYGAIGYKKFCYVAFPLLSEGVISAFGISFIVSFSQYFVTLLMGGGKIKTFATEMFLFINGSDYMISASFSMTFLFINLLVLLFVEILVRGFVGKGYHSLEG